MNAGQVAEIGWLALRRHPMFRAAAERNAAQILALHEALPPVVRWLTDDVGRAACLTRALQMQAAAGQASLAELLALSRQRHTASEGRVLQLFETAERAGLIRSAPADAPWAQRSVVFEPQLVEHYRDRVFVEIESASLVMPEIRPALAGLSDDAYFNAFLRRLHRFDEAPTRMPRNPSIRHFLVREGGLKMLYELFVAQAPDRTRLLEAAPLSRARLAARIGVSRSHVRRTFAEAVEAGYLDIGPDHRVRFSETMSAEAERHFALTFFAVGTSALAALRDLGLAAEANAVADATGL